MITDLKQRRPKVSGPRKSVLVLIKGLGLGGAESLLVASADHFDRERFDYEIGYFLPWKDALVPALRSRGLTVTCLGSRPAPMSRALPRLVSLLRRRRFDLIHAHLPWAGILARLAGRLCRVPAVVYTEHGSWGRLHPLTRWCNRATMSLNDMSIAVSTDVRDSMRLSPDQPIQVVANGVDCRSLAAIPDESAAVRDEFAIAAEDLLLVNVANLSVVKGHEDLLRAFRQIAGVQPATLLVVGQYRNRLDSLSGLARELGIADRVRFTGPRTDVPRLLKAADVFVLSSHTEGMPVSLLEAMAVGRPVVGTAVGGIPEVITDGEQGRLVAAKDPAALAAVVLELAGQPAQRDRLGAAAAARVRDGFDVSRMVARVEQIYDEVLEGSEVAAC